MPRLLLLVILSCSIAAPAVAQKWIATIGHLRIKRVSKVDYRLMIYPWAKIAPGASFTLLPLRNAPARIGTRTLKVLKAGGHCFGTNVHKVELKLTDPKGAAKIKSIGKAKSGNPIWPKAIVLTPASSKARLLSVQNLSAASIPSGHIPANVVAAADFSGNGSADAFLIRTCIDYRDKGDSKRRPKTDHRQCKAQGMPLFDQLFLRRGGKWTVVEYEDLC